jgi:phosphinothricin acetyltransferase
MTKLSPNNKYRIRQAEEEDVLAIVDIYNERVLNSVNVFNCIPVKLETKLEWFHDLKAKGYPLIVAVEIETEQVIGYSDLTQFKTNTGYVL